MKNLLLVIVMIFSSINAMAETPSSLEGHYYLSGVMETGSELLLRADGRFQWFISYGAVDQSAQGTWTPKNGKILLVADVPPMSMWERFKGLFNSQPEPTEVFKEMELRIDGKNLIPFWPGQGERGRYVRQ